MPSESKNCTDEFNFHTEARCDGSQDPENTKKQKNTWIVASWWLLHLPLDCLYHTVTEGRLRLSAIAAWMEVCHHALAAREWGVSRPPQPDRPQGHGVGKLSRGATHDVRLDRRAHCSFARHTECGASAPIQAKEPNLL